MSNTYLEQLAAADEHEVVQEVNVSTLDTFGTGLTRSLTGILRGLFRSQHRFVHAQFATLPLTAL